MTDKTENGDAPRKETHADKHVGDNTACATHKQSHRDTAASDSLSRALRNNYQSTVDEGVPDIFQQLIQKLK